MDKMCKKPEVDDLNKSLANTGMTENSKRCESPVFKCINQTKPLRANQLDSSDNDIPSYQINRSVKSRSTNKSDSETTEPNLPLSPIFSQVPLSQKSQFQSPSISSLARTAKNLDKTCQNKISKASVNNKRENLKPCGIFESLGMTDKDISWVSSMASPPPKQVPGSEFNTVEKATFFPEEKFQNIQPRALFSPTFDEDSGCHPITFTSESDDDEAYKSNIRLSDVCATLKQLEVQSFDQTSDTSAEKITIEKESLISPFIRAEKNKKLNNVKKKKKGALVISPGEKDKYEFSIGEDLKATKSDKIKSSNENNFIEDDSFQSMSFSCLDELCKTVVTEQSNSSSIFNCNDNSDTLVNEIDSHSEGKNAVKRFYMTKSLTEVHSVSSVDNLHSYAKALEEGNKNISGGNKIDQLYTDKGIIRLDVLSDFSKTDTVKQLHSETISEKNESNKKQCEKIADENPDWEKAKQYLSESQLNVSDSEIFRTVENLEKTLASQESKEMERLSVEDSLGEEAVFSQNSVLLKTSSKGSRKSGDINSGDSADLLEVSKTKDCNAESSSLNLLAMPLSAFTTASGTKISVSDKALSKAKEILRGCTESSEDGDCQKLVNCLSGAYEQILLSKKTSNIADSSEETLKKGFLDGFGEESKISTESLEKAKAFMLEHEALEDVSKSSVQSIQEQCKESKGVLFENVKARFITASGKEIQVSAKALQKAKSLMSEFEEDSKPRRFGDSESLLKGFSTKYGKKIQVSAKALERAKVLMADCIEKEKVSGMKGFRMCSGKPIQVSIQSLERAKALMSECDEGLNKDSARGSSKNQSLDVVQTLDKSLPCDFHSKPNQDSATFKNFSTGSGKTIQISSAALGKAKAFMESCEVEFKESHDELASVRIKELNHQTFNTFKGSKTEANACDINYEKSSKREENVKNSVIGFSTALGHKLEVSRKAIEKANAFWSKSDEIAPEMPLHLPKEFFETEPFFSHLEIPGRSDLIRQEDVLTKPIKSTNQGDQNKVEDSNLTSGCIQTLAKNFSETLKDTEENPSIFTATSGVKESNDRDEIIPSWLHVYSTSPSMTADRIELNPVISYENGTLSKSDREYLVKSPVLGLNDRFYGRKKSRKLRFDENKKLGDKNQNDFVVPYKISGQRTSMKRTSNLSLDFSVPFKKMKFLEDIMTDGVDFKLERLRAREEQEKIIKEKQRVKPLKGSYLNRKCTERQMSWMEAVAGSPPEVHSIDFLKKFGILEDVLQVNIETAISFKFKAKDFFGPNCQKNLTGIPTGDGCLLILDDENNFGVEEVKRAFLASPGVQPNLVPNGWVENHFKWIIWKLAHYERSFPRYFGRRCLTPNHVMLQLKYRYDREIDRNERSSLKKILERDDAAVKRLVLCVCGIKKVMGGESMGYELNLTDGWYSCPARSDPAMTRFIEEGKLHIGTKLLIQGATLVNCEQGVSPLEIGNDVYLKISTNSTRRTRWDTKLGFQKNSKNFPISLGSILPQGGPISRIDVIVVRVYPVLYMEKTLDGHHVTRNRRSEEKADAEYRRIQEQRMEIICDELQSEISSANYEKKFKRNSLINVEQDLDLHHLMETSSATSQNVLEKFSSNENDRFDREVAEKLEKRLEKEKLNKRNVTEFFRAKIVDFRKPDYNNPALLSVWNPNEDLTSLLSEGKVISLINVTISNSSRTHKPLQINTTRQTQYEQVRKNVKYPARKLTHLKDVSSKICPAFEEVDVVGMVALIQDVSHGSRLSQVVYLTDLEMNFIGVIFWGNCKDYGWENVLRISSVVACSNLKWKKSENLEDIPSLFVNENSVFSENPRLDHLKEEIERLKQNMPQDKTAFLSKCEEELITKLEDSKWRPNTSRNLSNDSNLKRTRPKICRGVNGFESKPTASSTPIKPFIVGRNSGEAEPSPIQERIEKLQSYGEPPSLIPLLVRNNAKRKFKKKS